MNPDTLNSEQKPTLPASSPGVRLLRFLSSMPVAIALLSLVALVSMIGTVLVQNRDQDFYLSRLGPFWYRVFDALDFFDMYSAWWFITIMGLLVLSVTAALVRHGPRFWKLSRPLRTMRPWPVKADGEFELELEGQVAPQQLEQLLRRHGFREFRQQPEERGSLLLARKGRLSRLGFFLVHGAVILICIGGLITSQLGFRGVMNLAEGESDNIVYVQNGSEYRRLQLPFHVRNDNFTISYYNTGMPSEYSSQLTLLEDGQAVAQKRITVNDPLRFLDITLYQASFGDAGSETRITLRDLTRKGFPAQQVESAVGRTLEEGSGIKLELKELRQHNVINTAQEEGRQQLQDAGPSLDILYQSPASGNITYRLYLAYPHMLAFVPMGAETLTYANLGFSPADSRMMELLAAYLEAVTAIEGEVGPEQRRGAFASALQRMAIPVQHAAELGSRIIHAEQLLRHHKLSMLFTLDGVVPKMYTGLQVTRDPGAPLVWSACLLLVIGLYMMIYMHEKRVWLRLGDGGRRLQVCAILSHRDKHPLHKDLQRLQTELAELGQQARNQ
ncbi:MAG: cytochrome c biogenesis protein ResB [Gammaproteobacteria bacterium]|nr:cytochrome c biogenesis protein ResB [Gammaproteobacteria bacterium]